MPPAAGRGVCVCVCDPHPLVVDREVVVQLHDALGLLLELPVRVLRPPLLEVAVAIVLAP